ncbi:MAG: dihydrofolate reductase [Bacteroidia bacterium]
MIISVIVVVDEKNGIGKDNQLLCHLPADLKYFRQTTTDHHILMGRKTFEALGKPLPNRTNIVISRSTGVIEGCVVKKTVEDGIEFAKANNEHELFITGGGIIFDHALNLADKMYITHIHHTFEADTFFPHFKKEEWKEVKNEFHKADEKNPYDFSFLVYERKVVM